MIGIKSSQIFQNTKTKILTLEFQLTLGVSITNIFSNLLIGRISIFFAIFHNIFSDAKSMKVWAITFSCVPNEVKICCISIINSK